MVVSRFRSLLAGVLALPWVALIQTADAQLLDNFDRSDSSAVGPGWVEKNPNAFGINAGAVQKQSVSAAYRDNVVYRVASENLANVEVTMAVRFTSFAPFHYPQLFARIQTATVQTADTLDAYMLYIPNSTTGAVLGRQTGNGFVTTLADIPLSVSLNTNDTYRLRLAVSGSSPVTLYAAVERSNGSGWSAIGQATVEDWSGLRITAAGSVGFGGTHDDAGYRYDNFERFNLGVGAPDNPVPQLTSRSPSSAQAGSGAFTLTVNGSNFVTTSVVRWNGANRPTTFVNAGQLTAQIPASDLTAAGTASVTVFSPTPGGGTSAPLSFTIGGAPPAGNPVPAITTLSPSTVTAGSGGFTLTVGGTGFVQGSVVRWNGASRPTTYVSATSVSAQISAGDVAAVGNASVSVLNPTPGGGTSGALTFNVASGVTPNPGPSLYTVYPPFTRAGSSDVVLTVWGSGFVGTSVVRWNGQPRVTMFSSPQELRVRIPASDLTSQTYATLTVVSPSPGGGVSESLGFDVIEPATGNAYPRVTTLSPVSWPRNGGALTIQVSGAGFVPGSVVHWNGQPRSTTYRSATRVDAAVSTADVSVAQVATVTVVTPSPGGGTSVPQSFFVLEQASSVFYDTFTRADSDVIGNGWTEKSPAAFQLFNGELISRETTYDYRDALIYRPGAEDRRDVEVAVEFRRQTIETGNFPQIHARVQRNTVAQPELESAYLLFINDNAAAPGEAVLAIQPALPGEVECFISTFALSSQLQFDERYRLRLRVTGSLPVQLSGVVEHFDEGRWRVIGSGSATHSNSTQANPNLFCGPGFMPPPITTGGTTGVSKYRSRTDLYDNYYWLDLDTGLNPVPGIAGVSPGSAVAGGGAPVTLTVNGVDFLPNSVVRWNGQNRATTYLSAGQLSAVITVADIAQSSVAQLTVFNPGPGGGQSAPLSFTVRPPSNNPNVLDDFERTDSSVLGNGWIQKSSAAFYLLNGTAAKQQVGTAYRDNVVFRPATESMMNAESSLEFALSSLPPGYPQVLVRVQTDTALIANYLDAYVLYINDSGTQAIMGRQRGDSFVFPLATISLSPGLTTSGVYRMRVGAQGTEPVQVSAAVERLNGAGGWDIIGQASAADNSWERIRSAGTAGFSGYVEGNYRFDNFDVRNLSP